MIRWAQKALTSMRHAMQRPTLARLLKRTRVDYAKEVGSGIDASVVMAPIQWVQRAFPEGRLRVQRGRGDEWKEVDGHPLVALLAAPNPAYSDEALWMATLFSWYTAGSAYWIKVRNSNGRVVELWYVPHWLMEPKGSQDDPEVFISHYDYTFDPAQKPWRLDVGDVVHFRHGIDPRNPRLGQSPLWPALREIFTDLEASNFVASLLRNMGIPGVVISPDGAQAGPDDIEAVKKWYQQTFGGDGRGGALVLGSPTKVEQFGFDPKQMDLSVARDVAEERVCALIGVPAAVVGFGAGLQTAKVGATMGELRTLAWTNGVLPVMRSLAGELKRSFPELVRDGEDVGFDTSDVLALAEYRLAQAETYNKAIQGGWAMVWDGRDAMGWDVDDSHRVFLRSYSVIEVPAGQPPRAYNPAPPLSDRTEDEPEDPEEPKALDLRGLLGAKDRRRPTPAQLAYAAALERLDAPLSGVFQSRLTPFFESLGKEAAAAIRPLLEPAFAEASAGMGETKNDELIIGEVLGQLELPLKQQAFQRLYEAQYLAVAEEVAKAGGLVGLATDLPDPVARAVVATGGRRSGLVDLSAQSREALFRSLAEGRAAGEGVEQLAARIAAKVGGGPWQTAETRARTIARTETKYAQNVSTLARARHEGIARFIVFDGRLGPGRSDPDHIARDGSIVDAQEADRMAAAEHPNGTLSFAPYFEETDS